VRDKVEQLSAVRDAANKRGDLLQSADRQARECVDLARAVVG
jgi:hypothetical protein